MKKINLNWFNSIEQKIWGEEVISNPYFATVSIYISALLGALIGGGSMLSDMFDWHLRVSLLGSVGFLWVLWSANVAESVFGCRRPLQIVWRSLLLFLCISLAFIVGAIASMLIIGIIVIVFAVWFFMTVFSMMLGGDRVKLTDGWGRTVTKGITGMGGDIIHGDDGKDYERGSDGKWHEI